MTSLDEIRAQAARRFSELGFPTTRNEEWRFTNVAPIAKTRFVDASEVTPNGRPRGRLDEALNIADGSCRLVFVNGSYSARLSTRKPPAGIVVSPLRLAGRSAEPHLARYAAYGDHAFVAWNTAAFHDGAYIEIPGGVAVAEPLYLIFLSTGADRPTVSHPRVLIVAGEASQATFIECYIGQGDAYLTNAVTELVAGDSAVVEHYKLQLEDERAFHVATLQAQLGRQADFAAHSLAFGGGLVRSEVNTVLSEGAHATLNGLYVCAGAQHLDNHTVIDHAQPHGASYELYKGILDGRSTAVFNGRIIVRKDAQKTDSKQSNRNLLLSEDAVINTKPELKIYADDVRCTHGATIGRLDADAMFYLRSRGIGRQAAQDLLIQAFAGEIIDAVKVAGLRSRLERLLWEKLHARRN